MRTLPLQLVFTLLSQSYNIDLGPGDAPSDSFGAAGQAGFWNLISAYAEQGTPLLDADGVDRGVTLRHEGGAFQTSSTPTHLSQWPMASFDIPGVSGDVAALLEDFDDCDSTTSASTFIISGLPPGPYRVRTYAVAPDGTHHTAVIVGSRSLTAGGTFSGTFIEGLTHTQHNLLINGPLEITVRPVEQFATVSGIQVEPACADVNGDGAVTVHDVLAIISFWGPCGVGDCSGDLNGDGLVNAEDLLEVIGNWGTCPGGA